MLVEFPSIVEAVACAAAWQAAIDGDIRWRIGINVGDVIIDGDGDDIYGDGVNIAARLEALAEPGGIFVSARVQEDAAGRLDLNFEDTGEQSLKNIARAVRVYVWRALTPTLARKRRRWPGIAGRWGLWARQGWRSQHPEFLVAMRAGRLMADAEVAGSLHKRAVGFARPAEKIYYDKDTKEAVRVPYDEYYPPDPQAARFWLTNRQRGLWAERHELTGAGGEPLVQRLEAMTDAQRLAEAVALVATARQAIAQACPHAREAQNRYPKKHSPPRRWRRQLSLRKHSAPPRANGATRAVPSSIACVLVRNWPTE